MKIKNSIRQRARAAFTLIEMIGVLAVIAILASLLVPKIFTAINNARVNSTAVSYNTVKTAIMDHYAKYGSLASTNGVAITLPMTNGFDRQALLAEGFLDKPFASKIGDGTTNTTVQAVACVAANIAVTAANSAYDLDGNDPNVNDVPGTAVIQTIISGVAEADARELSLLLDGPTMTPAIGTSDLAGRVKYATGSPTTVYIYVTHR